MKEALDLRSKSGIHRLITALEERGFIRPPGSLPEEDFLARCIKCDACLNICPTNVLQPAGLEGGFGSCVVDAACDACLDTRFITRMGIPARWIHQGSRAEQLDDAGIDAAAIARRVRTVLDADDPGIVPTVEVPARARTEV